MQGDVQIDNSTIEDFVILRNDGTPIIICRHQLMTEMKVTHIIRGDDHKINTFKQMQIYLSMKWELPHMLTFH